MESVVQRAVESGVQRTVESGVQQRRCLPFVLPSPIGYFAHHCHQLREYV